MQKWGLKRRFHLKGSISSSYYTLLLVIYVRKSTKVLPLHIRVVWFFEMLSSCWKLLKNFKMAIIHSKVTNCYNCIFKQLSENLNLPTISHIFNSSRVSSNRILRPKCWKCIYSCNPLLLAILSVKLMRKPFQVFNLSFIQFDSEVAQAIFIHQLEKNLEMLWLEKYNFCFERLVWPFWLF